MIAISCGHDRPFDKGRQTMSLPRRRTSLRLGCQAGLALRRRLADFRFPDSRFVED